MLNDLKKILGSTTKAFELIYVLEEVKPLARIFISEEKDIFDFLKQKKLSYTLSDFKICKYIDKTRNYSDKGISLSLDDERDGQRVIYISKDPLLTIKAKIAEERLDHKTLGNLMGYPDCCIDFFNKYFKLAKKTTNDLTIYTFENSAEFIYPWQNNICLRGFDISLISHFPCSFHCKKTIGLAEKNLTIIKKYDEDIASYFQMALKSAILYAEGVGVYSIKKYRHKDSHIFYDPTSIIASNNNELFNILKRRNLIKIIDKNNIRINEVQIQDDLSFFALFS